MRFFISILTTALITGVSATLPKANEYQSSDCSGPLNYGHHSGLLTDVTMDDTTHSVYLSGTTGDWSGWSDKESDGGECSGWMIGIGTGCVNLDTADPHGYRIKCVRNMV